MYSAIKIPAFLFIICAVLSCQKQVSIVSPAPVASLTIVNAIPNSNPLIATFASDSAVSTFYSTTQQVSYEGFAEYSLPSGALPAIIYQMSDTSTPLFSGNILFGPQTNYSLFLSTSISNHNGADTVLTTDNPPYHASTDSAVGIRIINLSPDSGPVDVNLTGNAPGSEVSGLAYKSVTPFKDYANTSTVPAPFYTFEFRSVLSDSLLAIFRISRFSIPRFKNGTIVFCGQMAANGAGPLTTFLVNNY